MLNPDEALKIEKGLIVLALQILLKKREDYSGSEDPYGNLRVAENHGVPAIVGTNIRCNDKLVRVSRIVLAGRIEDGGLVGESVIDDLRDVVNYVSIAAGLLAEQNESIKKQLLAAAEGFETIVSAL